MGQRPHRAGLALGEGMDRPPAHTALRDGGTQEPGSAGARDPTREGHSEAREGVSRCTWS